MKLKAILLTVLLGAAVTPLASGQIIETHTFTTNRVVPDGNASGLHDVRSIASSIANIADVKVRLKINSEFNGDLYAYVRHTNGFAVLLNRVGKTSGLPTGYDDSGFNVTFAGSAANGDIHTYRGTTNPAGGLLTGTWQPDARSVDPGAVTDASSRSAFLSSFNGLNAAGEWTLYLVDVESGGTNQLTEWALEITGATYPAIAWATPSDLTYGTALSGAQLNAAVTFASTNVNGTFTYTPAAGTVLNAGLAQNLAVTFTPADSASFLGVATNVSINVSKAPLTIAANITNKVYGAALPTLTASYTGFVNGETASVLDTPVMLTTTALASSPVGSYPITASGAADANYVITHVNGTLAVTPAPLTIAANHTNKVYGAAVPTFTATYTGLVNGDTSIVTPPTLATTASASSPVGTYPITVTGAADPNYAITPVNGTLTVTTVEIAVAAHSKTKAFGQALPEFTATYSGFVLSQGTNDLTALATITTTATATSDAGTYPITAAGATSPNYTFTYTPGSLTITQSVTSGSIVSSANPALPTANVTFTMTVAAVAPGAGTPTGTVDFRIDGSVAGSGTLAGGVATFSINTLALGTHTVVAEYGGSGNFIGRTNTLTPAQVINTPPVANNDTIERYPMQGIKVRLSTLLGNDSDADSDTLNITVSSTSASNGTVSVVGNWVYYTPALGHTNVDSFTYTITDGRGGSATGTVTVAIRVENVASENLTISHISENSYLIRGSGIPGRTYRLQSTDSLAPATWTDLPLGSVTADSAGRFEFTDTTGAPTRYYRSVYP